MQLHPRNCYETFLMQNSNEIVCQTFPLTFLYFEITFYFSHFKVSSVYNTRMKAVIFFVLFVGLILIIHGIYDQKYAQLKNNLRVEYRFIPRSFYEEQLANSTVSSTFKNMFNRESPWFEKTIGTEETIQPST